MSTTIQQYLNDGASRQSRVVLAMVAEMIGEGFNKSWDDIFKRYTAETYVGRWENCREQGYSIRLITKGFRDSLTLVFTNERNSDGIVVYEFVDDNNSPMGFINSPTINNFNDTIYGKGVHFNDCEKAAKYIYTRMNKCVDEIYDENS